MTAEEATVSANMSSTVDVKPDTSPTSAAPSAETPLDLTRGSNLLINYLPRSLTTADLERMFTPFGVIEKARCIVDRQTGSCQGYGFVQFQQVQSAALAVQHFSMATPPDGTAMKVSFARPADTHKQSNLHVSGLPITYDEDKFRALFAEYGPICELTLLRTPNGESRGSGFVRLESPNKAQAAMRALNDSIPPDGSSRLTVRFALGTKKEAMMSSRPGGVPHQGYPPHPYNRGPPPHPYAAPFAPQYGAVPPARSSAPYAPYSSPYGAAPMQQQYSPAVAPSPYSQPSQYAPGAAAPSPYSPQTAPYAASPYASAGYSYGAPAAQATAASANPRLAALEAQLKEAIETQQFERCAAIRDQIQVLNATPTRATTPAYSSYATASNGYGPERGGATARQQTSMQSQMYGSSAVIGGGASSQSTAGYCLYTAGLPYDYDEQTLMTMFGQFGQVLTVKIPRDSSTQVPKGYAFVTMASQEAGSAAIAALNGYPLGSRTLQVKFKIQT
uniref:Polyadenylate-binding protein n=1 Tax=Spongospora subterranea TaxID=70186 RepID=A0A0H5QHY2_9EUKA|eukprot:CRZ01257.1 hypothetical protein [Spongospora subterranea]